MTVPMYWLTTITAQQKSLGLLYPRFCRRYDLVRILPNLTSSAPPGASSLSSALVLLPYPLLHLASVPLSRQRALRLCTAVGFPPSFPPSLNQVLALSEPALLHVHLSISKGAHLGAPPGSGAQHCSDPVSTEKQRPRAAAWHLQ